MIENIYGYIIVVAIILCLVLFQLTVFGKTQKQIKQLKNIFPKRDGLEIRKVSLDSISSVDKESIDDVIITSENEEFEDLYYSAKNNYSNIEVFQIHSIERRDDTYSSIEDAINSYLVKNKGAVSDFMLIKDIVERNCDSKVEEVETQTPIPLYIGLMGTMVGIIVGIGSIAFLGNGFSSFIVNPSESIGELMGGVAIAMIASLIGIILTTIGSWNNKKSKTILEEKKNEFYSWIQSELLPVLSGNITNTLQLLQQNLSAFNESFANNVSRMEDSFGKITDTYENQVHIINLLKDMDMVKMSHANITVLQEFNKSAANFQSFSEYINSIREYLTKVNALHASVDSYLQSNALLELAQYFKEENSFFADRRYTINKTATETGNVLKESFDSFKEMADSNLNGFQSYVIQQKDKLKSLLEEQSTVFNESLRVQQSNAENLLEKEESLFSGKLKELDTVLEECRSMSSIKKSIEEWSSLMKQQNNIINSLRDSISDIDIDLPERPYTTYSLPLKTKICLWFVGVLVSIASIMAIIFFVKSIESATEANALSKGEYKTEYVNPDKINQKGSDNNNVIDTVDISKSNSIILN